MIWSAWPFCEVVLVSSLPSVRKFVANRGHDGSIFLLVHFDLMFIDPVQLDLIEAGIALHGRFVAVRFAVKSSACRQT